MQVAVIDGFSTCTIPLKLKFIVGLTPFTVQGSASFGIASVDAPVTASGVVGVVNFAWKQQVLPSVFTVPSSTIVATNCHGPGALIKKKCFDGSPKSLHLSLLVVPTKFSVVAVYLFPVCVSESTAVPSTVTFPAASTPVFRFKLCTST